MATMQLQFHADPDELVDELLPSWLAGIECYLAAESFWGLRPSGTPPPSRYCEVRGLDLRAAQQELGALNRVWVRPQQFRGLGEQLPHRFMELNRGPGMNLTIGHFVGADLVVSYLGAGWELPEEGRPWRRAMSRAKKSMLRLSVLVDVRGGRHVDRHPYTPGALELYRAGTRIVQIPGSSGHWELGETE